MIEALVHPIARLASAGGPVLVVIALVAVLLFTLALERLIYWQWHSVRH